MGRETPWLFGHKYKLDLSCGPRKVKPATFYAVPSAWNALSPGRGLAECIEGKPGWTPKVERDSA